jgi:hypothetical protein
MILLQRVFILLIVGVSAWTFIAESLFRLELGEVSQLELPPQAFNHEEPVTISIPAHPVPVHSVPQPSSESSHLSSNTTDDVIRFLWGIPTVAHDYKRRRLVRETYLSFYKHTTTPNRICSLVDVLNGIVSLDDVQDGACVITYVFFVGGNPSGPTELMKPNSSYPILIDGNDDFSDEGDIISLNIKENLEDGKSQTWFKYASMVVKENPSFDYIVKVDSDTLVFPPTFLDIMYRRLPRRPDNQRVYGGLPHDKDACDPKVNDTHSCPLHLKGGLYMAGSLYWMSPDLADFITSDRVNRKAISIGHEDVDIGNFIFSHPQQVNVIQINSRRAMNHRNFDMGWRRKPRAATFKGVMYGHSEDGFFPGPFFKSPRIYRKMWRSFEGYWQTGEAGPDQQAPDMYQLYDVAEDRRQQQEQQQTPSQVGNSSNPIAMMDTKGGLSSATGVRVQTNDYIYSDSDFDSSPIVAERFKLIFFTVAGVGDDIWRRLFRRMMGFTNWKTYNVDPYQQSDDGLRRLYDYTIEEASAMMSSPDYTRAIFVRDPRSRLIATYLNRVVGGLSRSKNVGDGGEQVPYVLMACCGGPSSCNHGINLPIYCQRACRNETIEFSRFLSFALQGCDQPWWRPQNRQMEPRFYPLLNFVGQYENVARDAQNLLERIGAWEEFGKTGWGRSGKESIFQGTTEIQQDVVQQYFNNTEIQKIYKAFEVYETFPFNQ